MVGSYEGALAGKYRIRLQLSTRDSVLTGQYYYLRNGRLLRLEGHQVAKNGDVALRETAEADTVVTGRFVGRLQPDRSLTGTWHNAAGSTQLPFQLTRVTAAVAPAAAKARLQQKTYLRTFEVPVCAVPDAGVTALLAHWFSLENLTGENLASLREQVADQHGTQTRYGIQELVYDVGCNTHGLLSVTAYSEGVGASIWHSYRTQTIDLNTGFPVYVADEIRPEALPQFLALGERKLQKVVRDYLADQGNGSLEPHDKEGVLGQRFTLASTDEYTVEPTGLLFDHQEGYDGQSNLIFKLMQGSLRVLFTYAELRALAEAG